MSDYIKNDITIQGEDDRIQECLEFIKDDKLGVGSIDLNKITPVPKWVYGSTPDTEGYSNQKLLELGSINTMSIYAKRHWNTKWNADLDSEMTDDQDYIIFTTLDNNVRNLVNKLAWIFPDLQFVYMYAHEDFGRDVGEVSFHGADVFDEVIYEEYSQSAQEKALEIWFGEIPDYYIWNEYKGLYIHEEEIEEEDEM